MDPIEIKTKNDEALYDLGEHLKSSQSGTLQIQPVEVADDCCVATLRGEARGR